MKKLTLLSLALSVLVCGAVFDLKSRVNTLNAHIKATENAVTEAEQQQHVLRAEWAHLTEPEQLQKVVDANLPLQPLTPMQFASLADIPGAASVASLNSVDAIRRADAASKSSFVAMAQTVDVLPVAFGQ